MKRCMKLWMVLLIALLLTVIYVPTAVFAADEIASGTCGAEGDNLKWTLQNNYLLTISGEGEMTNYSASSLPWRDYKYIIKGVVVKNGVTSIGDYAFDSCSEVESVTIGSGVKRIGVNAFDGCRSLVSVTIPSNVKNIENYAFDSCSKLKNITLQDGVTSIGDGAFQYCDALMSINLPSSVTNIGEGVFFRCKNLPAITVDSGSTSYSSDNNGVLFNKDKTSLIIYPYGKTAESYVIPQGVKSIEDSAFSHNFALASVTIPSSVRSIGECAFYACSELTSAKIPNGVTSIGAQAFSGCEKLTAVTIPSSVTVIDDEAFSYCTRLESIIIPENTEVIGICAFYKCFNLDDITFKGAAPEIRSDAFSEVTAKANYPANNPTWTSSVKKDYGGNITWCVNLPMPKPTITIDASSGKPQMKWAAVDGAVKYEIHRATSKTGTYTKLWTQKGVSYKNTTAIAGKTYYYKVRAVDAMGNAGKFSAIKSITCDCAKPVTTLTVNSDTGKPRMTWKKVDGASKYEVYRATSKTGTYSKMLTTTGTTYTNTTAVPGKTYYYKVKAICGATTYGNSAFSTAKSITCDCAKPVVTIGRNTKTGKPQLKWKAVEGATKYEIYRATSKNGTYYKQYTQQSTTYTNTTAKAGTTYYYKVKAICGKSSYGNSALSAVKSITSK